MNRCSSVSVADAAANPNGMKTNLANGLSTLLIINNPGFNNSSKSLFISPPDCPILCNWVFGNFILPDESFAIA